MEEHRSPVVSNYENAMMQKIDACAMKIQSRIEVYSRYLGRFIIFATLLAIAFIYVCLLKVCWIPWDVLSLLKADFSILSVLKLFSFLLIHILGFGFLLPSYVKTVWGNPGYIALPTDTTIEQRRETRISNNLEEGNIIRVHEPEPESEGSSSSAPLINSFRDPNYCYKCEITRPSRTHHCKVCQQCVLHMDHHCPFINNCVGFLNMKAFLLVMFYSFVLGFIVLISLGIQIIYMIFSPDVSITDDPANRITLMLAGGGTWICVSLFGGALAMGFATLQTIIKDESPIDALKKRSNASFSDFHHPQGRPREERNGLMKNVKKVMGQKVWHWFFPWIVVPFPSKD